MISMTVVAEGGLGDGPGSCVGDGNDIGDDGGRNGRVDHSLCDGGNSGGGLSDGPSNGVGDGNDMSDLGGRKDRVNRQSGDYFSSDYDRRRQCHKRKRGDQERS